MQRPRPFRAAKDFATASVHSTFFLLFFLFLPAAAAALGISLEQPAFYASQTPPSLAGTYRGRAPAADAAQRVFTLVLAADGSATFTTLYIGKDSATERGHWDQTGKQLVLTFEPMGPNAPPDSITFRYDRNALRPVHWDPSEWGKSGPPVLYRSRSRAESVEPGA